MLVLSSHAVTLPAESAPSDVGVVRFRFLFDAAPLHNDLNAHSEAAPAVTSSGKSFSFREPEELIVPVPHHLSRMTVAELAKEFSKRVERKFPLSSHHTCAATFLVRQPNDIPMMDLPSLEGPDGGQERDGDVYWKIDTRMNMEDTLDGFFTPAGSAAEAKTYELIVEWGEAPTPREAAGVPQLEQATEPVMRLGDCLRLSEARLAAKERQSTFFPPAPAVMMTQRSTYLDILHLRRSRREEDKANEYYRLTRERRGESTSDDLLPDAPSGGIVSRRREAQYAARRELADTEQRCRADIREEEQRGRQYIDESSHDSMKHILTLATLKGNFLTNGKWLSMIRRHVRYPFDTEPLVPLPSTRERQHLHVNSDNTAVMSFRFKTNEEYLKAKRAAEAAERERKEREANVQYRDKILDLVLEDMQKQKEAKHHHLRAAWYQEQDKAVPPPTPSPPPTPRTPSMEHLGAGYEDLLAVYLEFRHEIIAMERKDFREMVGLMRVVLRQQEAGDRAAVELAYEEELQATNALCLDAYMSYDPQLLEEETEYVEPWVMEQQKAELLEKELARREAEGAKLQAMVETPRINVVRVETEEEFRARVEANRQNPFRFQPTFDPEARFEVVSSAINSIAERAGDRLQERLILLRLQFAEKSARTALSEREKEEFIDLRKEARETAA